MLVRWLVRWSVGPHITLKTDYAAIASRRREGRGNQLMLKTGYVEIASRLVTVARSCFLNMPYQWSELRDATFTQQKMKNEVDKRATSRFEENISNEERE
jgi:hypothetical protein